MDYKKYAENETRKGNLLSAALVGSCSTFILMGQLFQFRDYSFFTIAPLILLLFCLWWPFLQSRNFFLK